MSQFVIQMFDCRELYFEWIVFSKLTEVLAFVITFLLLYSSFMNWIFFVVVQFCCLITPSVPNYLPFTNILALWDQRNEMSRSNIYCFLGTNWSSLIWCEEVQKDMGGSTLHFYAKKYKTFRWGPAIFDGVITCFQLLFWEAKIWKT